MNALCIFCDGSFLRASSLIRQRSFRNALGERGEWEIGALNSASNIIPLNAFVNNAFSGGEVRSAPFQLGSTAYFECYCRHWNCLQNSVMVANFEGETSITDDETRDNKRLSPLRTTDNPQTCLPPSFSISITYALFSNTKRDYVWCARRNGVIHFRRNTTALFDGTIFHVRAPPCTIASTFLDDLPFPVPSRPFNKAHRSARARSSEIMLTIYCRWVLLKIDPVKIIPQKICVSDSDKFTSFLDLDSKMIARSNLHRLQSNLHFF